MDKRETQGFGRTRISPGARNWRQRPEQTEACSTNGTSRVSDRGILVRPQFILARYKQLSAMHLLQSMLQHRTVDFVKNIVTNLDLEIRPHSQDVRVVIWNA